MLLAIPIGMLAYTGIETVSNMAEEAKDETRTIPQAISRVRFAVFAIFFTLPFIALSALPVREAQPGDPIIEQGGVDAGDHYTLLGLEREEGGFASDPIAGVVQNMDLGPFQEVAGFYVGLLAATVLTLATNAGLIGVSRLVYSMGLHRQLPDALRQLHPKFGTPWIGILVFGGAAILALIPGQAAFLGSLYSFGALLSFTVAHVSVARLRKTQPDKQRPYRGPGNVRIRGYDAPLFAIVGGFFTTLSFLVICVLNPTVALTGIGWLVLGLIVYLLYRRALGLDLVSTHKVAIPQPVVDHEAEYDSVLVAVNADDPYDARLLATAIKLAARRRRGIHVIVTIPVPYALQVDAPLPEPEGRAASVIEQARVQGGRRVTGHWEKVRPGQAGRRIIEEAEDMRASAIVMALPRRVAGGSLFGKTLETVLADRPCRVVIESSAEDGAARGAQHAAMRVEAVR
jgi:APA family basic amino acid/polyamine antiporter